MYNATQNPNQSRVPSKESTWSSPQQQQHAQQRQDNTCLLPSTTPGCSFNVICEATVCQSNPICCQLAWTQLCVDQAQVTPSCDTSSNNVTTALVTSTASPSMTPSASSLTVYSNNDCFEASSSTTHDFYEHRTGCSNTSCQTRVCQRRPKCCFEQYDYTCVVLAVEYCDLPLPPTVSCVDTTTTRTNHSSSFLPPPTSNTTTTTTTTPSSSSNNSTSSTSNSTNTTTISSVTSTTPLEASALPSSSSLPPPPPPGCNDEQCLRAVCQIDPSCCANSYNHACVVIAQTLQVNVCGSSNSNNESQALLPNVNNNEEEQMSVTQPPTTLSNISIINTTEEQVNGSTVPPTLSITSAEQVNSTSNGSNASSDDADDDAMSNENNHTNHCFETSITPGCNDQDCLELVCLEHPFCCQEGYNQTCIDSARHNGLTCVPPLLVVVDTIHHHHHNYNYSNNCLDVNPFGGCTNTECQTLVCHIQPQCCNRGNLIGAWTEECVLLAREQCTTLLSNQNTCFQSVFTPGCTDDTMCAQKVCQQDKFCCQKQWDKSCVELAIQLAQQQKQPPEEQQQEEEQQYCQQDWPRQENTCFEVDPFRRPGCRNSDDGGICERIVCITKPECCDVSYNEECVELALKRCELPTPENHCFAPSNVPSCTDDECLTQVCEIDPTCCTVAYTDRCVNIARNNTRSCSPPKITNTCFQTSPYGGCSDPRCQELVCEISPDCCNSDHIGEWSSLCVSAAEELCQPEILPKQGKECPFGMTCGKDVMSNCTDLVIQYRDVFELGDVYGGMYCGNNATGTMQNCPRGMYCPNPETMLPCPAGFYCPHKTATPTIKCRKCQEGALELTQDLYGYIVLSIILFFVVIYIALGVLNRYNKRLADRISDFEKRVIVNRFHGTMKAAHHVLGNNNNNNQQNKQQQKQLLEKLRPKLEFIARRLSRLEKANPKRVDSTALPLCGIGHRRTNSSGSSPGHVRKNSWGRVTISAGTTTAAGSSSSTATAGHHIRKNSWGTSPGHVRKNSSGNGLEFVGDDIRFDARRVFDILDADASGDVSFEELNVVMGFTEGELQEFIRRMNEMAGLTNDSGTVTRPVFVKYFLQALLETTKLTVTFEEAAKLFDEMAGASCDRTVEEINMNKFYESSMSDFLSDTQIFEIIRGFKALKTAAATTDTPTGAVTRSSVWGGLSNAFTPETRKSMLVLPSTNITTTTSIPRPNIISRRVTTVSGVPSHRPSMKSLISSRMRSLKSLTDDVDSLHGHFVSRNSIRSMDSLTGRPSTIPVQSTVTRDEFIEHYPQLLTDIMLENDKEDDVSEMRMECLGVDICFKNLSLSVKLGNKQYAKVVDGITGRIRAKSMTGILGGSGAGKTSLLNCLCGRAYYGETKGTILVNGHEASIEDFKHSVGFVPQDDIVYAELTVRENLIYSGRFRLPRVTTDREIEELADETLASLGLSRVADSPVGDIRRRGVSGGERKRVSIGLELMALPSILFLDEPTSGLDASSALLVMKSLKHLVEKDGVTVVSVIHQPRKFIYDLFDSLILLGVGGKMVYHGPTENAESYFSRLNYSLPQGESMADWLIDISSGRLEPDNHVAVTKLDESAGGKGRLKRLLALPSLRTVISEDEVDSRNRSLRPKGGLNRQEVWDSGALDKNPLLDNRIWEAANETKDGSPRSKADDATIGTSPLKDSSDGSDHADAASVELARLVRKISFDGPRSPESSIDGKEDHDSIDTPISRRSTSRLAAAGRVVTDDNCVGAKGVTTGKVVQALAEAKQRRAWLCDEWSKYFAKLKDEDKSIYEPPPKYSLPLRDAAPSLWSQFRNQFKRHLIVGWRNRFSKTIDFTIIVLAVITITALDGVTTVSEDDNPEIPYDVMVRPLEDDLSTIFEELFSYSITHQIQYPLKVGIILCVLLGLTATKTVTSKRLEFFREAGSGYNLNAYFWAVSILSTLEHSVQVVIAAFFASWIRNPIASNASYYIHFLLLAWVTVGWALLIPMAIPADNVTLVAGFFFAFCGLMFSGAFAPVTYHDIYEDGGFKEVFAGWISPTRFFYEALAVGEYRCLPEQSGHTIEESSVNRQANSSMTIVLGYAGHDYNAVRWSCSGWYWSVIPVLLIGFTIRYLAIGAMHALYRGQQTKKPLMYVIRRDRRVAMATLLYFLGFAALFSITTWLFVRDQPFKEAAPPSKAELLRRYGFFD